MSNVKAEENTLYGSFPTQPNWWLLPVRTDTNNNQRKGSLL